MKSTIAAILMLVLSGTSVSAQMGQPPGRMNGQPGVAMKAPASGPMAQVPMMAPMPPPPPPAVPAERLARAIDFLTISGTHALIDAYVERISPMATTMAQRQIKPTDAAAQKDVATAMNAALKSGAKEILENTARYYASHFSDAELDAMIAFFKSPAGKKYVDLSPVLQKESSQVVRSWGMQMQMVTMQSLVQKVAQAHPGSLAAPPAVPSMPPPAKPGAPSR